MMNRPPEMDLEAKEKALILFLSLLPWKLALRELQYYYRVPLIDESPPSVGRPAHPPQKLISLLILVIASGFFSFRKILAFVKRSPALFRAIGYESVDELPSLGTLYNFFHRLRFGWQTFTKIIGPSHRPLGHHFQMDILPGSLDGTKETGVVNRKVRQGVHELSSPDDELQRPDIYQFLLHFLSLCVLERHCGFPQPLDLVIDGSLFRSHASRFGVDNLAQRLPISKLSESPHIIDAVSVVEHPGSVENQQTPDLPAPEQNPIQPPVKTVKTGKATLPRKWDRTSSKAGDDWFSRGVFSDPNVCYGYSNHHGWVFGHKMSVLSARVRKRCFELVMRVDITKAKTHDSSVGVDTILGFHRFIRKYHIKVSAQYLVADTAYGGEGFYQLGDNLGYGHIAPLSQKEADRLNQLTFTRDKGGNPLCPVGKKMKHFQYDKKIEAHIYHCPAKWATRVGDGYEYRFRPESCPQQKDCCPEMAIGPMFQDTQYKRMKESPAIERGSEKWKEIYAERTASERVNAFIKNRIPEGHYRRQWVLHGMLVLAAVVHNIQALIAHEPAIRKLLDSS